MDNLSITSLLSKYQSQKPLDFGEYQERQYPVSAVIEIIRELKSENLSIQFAEWLSENEWVKRTHTHPNKVGMYYSHKHCEYKTIEELFTLFTCS
jgi:hypothetical protein